MKKSLVALLIALVIVCVAAVAFAAPVFVQDQKWPGGTEVEFAGSTWKVAKLTDKAAAGTVVVTVAPDCKTVGWVRFYVATPEEAAAKGFAVTKDTKAGVWFFDIRTAKGDHSLVYSTGTADCSTVGTVVYTCKVCGAAETIYGVKYPDKHADAGWYNPVVIGAPAKDCTEYTTFVQYCDVCKQRHTYQEQGAHVRAWVLTTPATCTTEGVKTSTKCVKGCEMDKATEKVPALGHDMAIVDDVKPTCTEFGAITFACTRKFLAADYEVVAKDAKGNEYVVEVIPAGTVATEAMIKAGAAVTTCTETDVMVVKPLGHIYSANSKTISILTELNAPDAAICYYTDKKCDRCGYYDGKDAVAVFHNYGAWTCITEPTADHAGYWVAICDAVVDGVKCDHHLDCISYSAPIDANKYVQAMKKVPGAKPTVSIVKKTGKIVVSAKLNAMAADKVVITVTDAEGNVVASAETAPKTKVTFALEKGTYKVAVKACVADKVSKTVTKSVKVK